MFGVTFVVSRSEGSRGFGVFESNGLKVPLPAFLEAAPSYAKLPASMGVSRSHRQVLLGRPVCFFAAPKDHWVPEWLLIKGKEMLTRSNVSLTYVHGFCRLTALRVGLI